MARYIRYLENGVWKYASVKSVGDLENLLTKSKTDIVSAINELIANGGALEHDLNSRFDGLEGQQNELVTITGNVQETLGRVQGDLLNKVEQLYVDEQIKKLVNKEDYDANYQKIEGELLDKVNIDKYNEEYQLVTGRLNDKTDLSAFKGVEGRVATTEQEITNVKGELGSKIGKTEFDGAVGLNRWVATKYDINIGSAGAIPSFSHIKGKQPNAIIDYDDNSIIKPFTGDYYIGHYFTNVYMKIAKTVTLTVTNDDGAVIYMNGAKMYEGATRTTGLSVAMTFRAGWNTVEILHYEHSGAVEQVSLGLKLSAQVDKLTSVIGVGDKNDTRLVEAETQIKQNAEAILLKAEGSVVTSLGNKVTANETSISLMKDEIKSLVKSDDFNKYTGRLESAESTITQHSTEIRQKVEKKDYDALNNIVGQQQTSINQLTNEIDLKATKSEYDGLNGRVGNAETQLNLNTEAIKLTATKTELDKTNGRLQKAESQLTVQTGQISTKVTQEDIDKSIDNVEAMTRMNGLELLDQSYVSDASKIPFVSTSGAVKVVASDSVGLIGSKNVLQMTGTTFLKGDLVPYVSNGSPFFVELSVYNKDTTTGKLYAGIEFYDSAKKSLGTNDLAIYAIDQTNTAIPANTWKTFSGYAKMGTDSSRDKASYVRIRLLTRWVDTTTKDTTGVTFVKDITVKNLGNQNISNLNTRLSSAETTIVQNAQDILLRAKADDVYKKTEADGKVLTAVSQAKGEIKIDTDKISQNVTNLTNTVTSQGNTITSHETSITQMKGDINLRAETKNVYTKTEADGKVSTAVTNAKAEIKITTDGISQNVTNVKGDLSTLNGTVVAQGTQIKQTSDEVAINVVKKGNVKASINASTEGVKIGGAHIDITGAVTFSSLDPTMQGKVNAGTDAKSQFDAMRLGGNNLILDSHKDFSTTSYLINMYTLSEDWVAGEEYTFVVKGTVPAGQKFGVWMNGGSDGSWWATTKYANGVTYVTFKAVATKEGHARTLNLYNAPSNTTQSTVDWVALYKGNKPMDWMPAPSDFDKLITSQLNSTGNLLRNSGNFRNLNGWVLNGGKSLNIVQKDGYSVLEAVGSIVSTYGIKYPIIKAGVEYVYTTEIMFSKDTPIESTTPMHYWFFDTGGNLNALDEYSLISTDKVAKANTWTRISVLFKTRKTISSASYFKPFIYGATQLTDDNKYWVKNVMFSETNRIVNWSPSALDVIDMVNDVTVGAKNLLDGTSFDDLTPWNYNGSLAKVETGIMPNGVKNGVINVTGTPNYSDYGQLVPVEPNTEYTLSLNGGGYFQTFLWEKKADKTPTAVYTENKVAHSVPWDMSEPRSSFTRTIRTQPDTRYIQFLFRVQATGTGVTGGRFALAKLEKGNKDSDWSLSEKDISKLITNADQKAQDSKNAIAEMSNDNKATPLEKQQLKKEWATITAEKPQYEALATTYGVTTEKTNYVNAYNTLNTAITPIIANTTVTSDISGATFRNTFDDYYDKKSQLVKKINETAKSLADGAQGTANTANGKADTANTAINTNKATWDRASNINSNGTFNSTKLSGLILDAQLSSAVNWNGAKSLLDTWKSGTSLINGGMLATNSVFAQHIAIGDFTNLSQINEEKNPNGYPTALLNNKRYFKIGNGAYAPITIIANTYVEFLVNDEYYIAFNGYRDAGLTGLNAIFRYYYSDGTYENAGTISVLPTAADTRIAKNLKITTAPNDAKTLTAVNLFFEKDGTAGSGYYYIRDIEVRKRYTGELIVDGSVKAQQLDVASLFAHTAFINSLKAQEVNADKIIGGTIKGIRYESINASNKTIKLVLEGNTVKSYGAMDTTAKKQNYAEMKEGGLSVFEMAESGSPFGDKKAFVEPARFNAQVGSRSSAFEPTELRFYVPNMIGRISFDVVPLGTTGYGLRLEAPEGVLVKNTYGNNYPTLQFDTADGIYFDGFGNIVGGTNSTVYSMWSIKDGDGRTRIKVPVGKGQSDSMDYRAYTGGHKFYHNDNLGIATYNKGSEEVLIQFAGGGNFKYWKGGNYFECKNSTDSGFIQLYASAFNTASSLAWKTDIENYGKSALDVVMGANIVTYKYKSDVEESENPHTHVGIIAEYAPKDIQSKDGRGIDNYAMSSLAWKAIQELSEQVRYLKEKLNNR